MPEAYSLCKMLQLQSEALTLFFFGIILFVLLAEESFGKCGAEARAAGEGVGATILRALRAGGKKKHFGVPPFGCCLRPLMSPHNLTPQHLMLARCVLGAPAAPDATTHSHWLPEAARVKQKTWCNRIAPRSLQSCTPPS